MGIEFENEDIKKIIVVGDRVLIKPRTFQERTSSGLFLPPGVQEKENLLTGYIVKVGPGYPIPAMFDPDEPWRDKGESVKYIPLQAREGDLAVFLHKNAYELEFNKEKYYVVPHNAILLIIRDEYLFA